MRPLPTAPSADDEISASFMRRLIECIKERTILSAPGYRTRSGPNGTTLEIGRTKGGASSAAAKTPGRFEYEIFFEAEEGEEVGSRKIRFKNCYFDLAGRTLQAGGLDDDFNLPDGEVVVALRVDATGRHGSSEIVLYSGDGPLSQMQSAQGDVEYYITPLYLFTDGALTCDFRTGPYVAMGETAL